MLYGNQSKSYLSDLVKLGYNSFKAFSYQKLPVSNSVVSLTVPAGTRYCEIRLESTVTTQVAVRFLITGGTPSTTDGMCMNHLDLFDITDYQNIVHFKAIQTTSGTHTLHITYYK